ncbi:MAG TPA: SDR family oxidoreductase [Methylomirabilota bacterium]|jgi:pteridine reductase|nr:SDR family oxidoreductase [Methylomirabilota bacterium]
MQIENKVFIITGAARIGLDTAKKLSGMGAKLVLTYLNTKPAEDLGKDCLFVQADVSKSADVQKVISQAIDKFGQIDGVIHMAATYKRTPWTSISEGDWDDNLNVIAKSAFLMAKAAAPHMPMGKIIFISDWSVLTQPYKDYLAYNVAKAAVEGLTKSLAKELAPNISVNCIAPGPILKPADLADEENTEVLKNTPLKRWGGAEEITKAVLYLLDSDFTTGQILFVDGGRSIA